MADQELNDASTEAVEAPKKRATRTRRTAAQASPEAHASEAAAAPVADVSADEAPAKPKRTRARKTAGAAAPAAAAPEAPASEPAAAPQAAAAPVPAGDHADEAPKPRARRTRRAAKDADAAPAPAPDAAPAADPAPAPAPAAPAAAAPTEPAITMSQAAAAEAAAGIVAEEPAPAPAHELRRRPGRSTRLRSEASSASEAPAETAAAEALAASAQQFQRREKRPQQPTPEQRQAQSQRDRQSAKNNKNRGNNQGQQGRGAGGNDQFRTKRQRQQNQIMVPKTTEEDLVKLKVAELREKAAELGIDATGLKKAELVEQVLEASVRAEGFIEVEGVLDILQDGYGFLRTKNYLPSEGDVYVGLSLIRRNGLRKGDWVKGQTRPARENEKFAALQQVLTVNGKPVEELGARVKFGDLTPVFPDECLIMEHGRSTITARVIDLVSPIGKGQRGLIVSPPKAGKTTILKDIAAAITANNPEVHLMCLLVDERPEEVTDMQRSIKGEVISSTFDMPTENHIAVAELVIERAKRLVEQGEDVVILLDSLTRLARAYNLAQPASGRILSGGVDSTALYPPKKFLGAARNIEGGGSLTILASALVETGSKMDEVIFEEFKGTGNMELKLDRSLADRRIFPAIDPVTSGTRKEDLLLNPQEAPLIWAVRRILANMNSTERAMDTLIKSLKQTQNNQEFLIRTAKKAQSSRGSADDNFEL